MSDHQENGSPLEQVDSSRRVFLGTLLAGGTAAATMTTVALGQGAGKGKAKGGKGAQGAKGAKGGKGKGGGRPSPDQMAARLIKEHDKDGDGALNAEELTAALTAMMQRRAGVQGAPGGGAGKGKGGAKGKGKGNGGAGGGVRPKRPGAEEE